MAKQIKTSNMPSCEFVNPQKAYPKVFIFPIHKMLKQGASVYDATRKWWRVKKSLRERPFGIAVGVKDKISQGVFEISNDWYPSTKEDKHWEFNGAETDATDGLHNKDWSKIINKAIGYWQRGNYLVVEFDGKGKFRFIRGGGKNKGWCLLRT